MRNLIEMLPIYRARGAGVSLLDPARPFFRAQGYQWRGYAVPTTSAETLTPLQQIEEQVSVKPGSWLLSITAVSTASAGMRFQIFDRQTGQAIFSEFVSDYAGAGNRNNGHFSGRPLPFILPAPYLVSEPGLLTVQIASMSATANNDVRMLLAFAEPIKEVFQQ